METRSVTAANYTRAVRACQPEGSGLARVTSEAPFSTACPTATWTVCTVPGRGARSSFSIFIASTTTSPAPASTCCPSATSIRTTRPGIGARTVPPPGAGWLFLPIASLLRLGRDGPRLSAEQQMIERRPRYRGEIAVEPHPIHGHAVPVHLDLVGLRANRHEVLHSASITATVSTSAIWGNRSNARTAVTR